MWQRALLVCGALTLLPACRSAAPPPTGAPHVMPMPPATEAPPAAPGERWVTYEAPDGSFTVDFPFGAPSIRHLQHGVVSRTDHATYDSRINATFLLEVFENDPRYRVANAADLLASYPNPAPAGVDGRVVSDAPLQQGIFPGREVRIEGTVSAGPGLVTQLSRAFVADGRMYLITVSAGPGSPLSPCAQRFLDSFRILW